MIISDFGLHDVSGGFKGLRRTWCQLTFPWHKKQAGGQLILESEKTAGRFGDCMGRGRTTR